MKRLQQGFTLIELMIVVAIVGILAAIALPAYQDYIIRSKLSEAEAALAACKTSVAEYTSSHAGTTPSDLNLSGCSDTATQYVASLAIVGGGGAAGTPVNIVVTTQATGATPAACTLTLTSNQAGTFEITSWAPTFGGCDAKFVPSSFR
jgi:type IV pilus assembly protein PilA